jgi:hypothetical protein
MAEQDFPCYASGCSTLCKELTPLASCTSRASPGISREHSYQVSLLVLLDTLQSMKNSAIGAAKQRQRSGFTKVAEDPLFGKLAQGSDANAGSKALCPNIEPKSIWVKVRTRFPHVDSFYDNRLFIRRKDVLQISTHCLEAFALQVVRGKGIPSCPNLEPNFRSLGRIRPNIRPIYQDSPKSRKTRRVSRF